MIGLVQPRVASIANDTTTERPTNILCGGTNAARVDSDRSGFDGVRIRRGTLWAVPAGNWIRRNGYPCSLLRIFALDRHRVSSDRCDGERGIHRAVCPSHPRSERRTRCNRPAVDSRGSAGGTPLRGRSSNGRLSGNHAVTHRLARDEHSRPSHWR